MAKVSSSVILGTFFLSLTLACASEPEPDSGYSQVCEDGQGIRLVDSECYDDDDRGHPVYYPHGTQAAAVGSKMPPGGTTTRPSGSIGSFPKSGGLGSHGGTTGS